MIWHVLPRSIRLLAVGLCFLQMVLLSLIQFANVSREKFSHAISDPATFNASSISAFASLSGDAQYESGPGGVYINATHSSHLSISKNGMSPGGGKIYFDCLINEPYLCSPGAEENGSVFLIIEVHSHFSHKRSRDAIRSTWGKISRDYDRPDQIRLVFLLGNSPNLTDVRSIERESKLYGDIIMFDFLDTYRNLTLKSLMGMQWAIHYCSQARFMLKTDDDVYFNVSKLLYLLKTFRGNNTVLGAVNMNAPVMRNGLWGLTKEEFPAEMYPSYCSGNSYAMSMETAKILYHNSHQVPLIPIEDVYITGLLAKISNVTCEGNPLFPHWYVGPSLKHICLLLDERLIALHNVPYFKIYDIHDFYKKGYNCYSFLKNLKRNKG